MPQGNVCCNHPLRYPILTHRGSHLSESSLGFLCGSVRPTPKFLTASTKKRETEESINQKNRTRKNNAITQCKKERWRVGARDARYSLLEQPCEPPSKRSFLPHHTIGRIDGIDHLSQSTQVFSIEVEDQTRHICKLRFARFFR